MKRMTKTLSIVACLAVVFGSTIQDTQAFGQCFRGLFRGRQARYSCYQWTQGTCTTAQAVPTTCEPCAPCSIGVSEAEVYESKKQAEAISEELDKIQSECNTSTPSPCEPTTTTCEPCAPCETTTCEPCDAVSETTTCVNGVCPIRKPIANTVRAIAETAVESVQLAKINATRARYGRRSLALDVYLLSGSKQQSNWMANWGRLQHGRGGYGGEIIAMNYGVGIDTAIQQWLHSPAHCALLLNKNFTRAGVATQRDRYGRNWCTVRFM